MHDLQLVGVHDAGEHLVLTGGDGQRYRVPIDEQLRAAVRRDRARLGQLRIEVEGGVRPRDIQARIRAGQTAEQVAGAAGLPIQHVRRYEGPVLAERAHVVDLARRLPARQVPERPPFGELVSERLAGRGADAGSLEWDAWRRQGSTWTVQLRFSSGSRDRRACWAFDVHRSHLEPQDDEARWLSAAVGGAGGPVPGRRLAAVSERVYDVEADGGVRTASPGTAEPAESQEAASGPAASDDDAADEHAADGAGGHRTLDLLDALRGRRGRRQPLAEPDDVDERYGSDLMDELLPPAAHPPASRSHEAADAEMLALPEGAVATLVEDDEPDESADVEAPDAESEPAPKPRKAARSSKKPRASVPSWDDIVFGAKRE